MLWEALGRMGKLRESFRLWMLWQVREGFRSLWEVWKALKDFGKLFGSFERL